MAKSQRFLCRLPDGSLMEITKVYALDAVFDTPEDVPEDVISTYVTSVIPSITSLYFFKNVV